MVPKRESTVKSSYNELVRRLKHPGSWRIEVGGAFFHRAAIEMKLKKVPLQVNTFQEFVTLPTS